MTFVRLFGKQWSLIARGAASVAGSYATIDRRMIAYSAMALAGWAPSEQLALGAGMLVTGGFGQLLPLPALSVRWKPRDDLRIDVFVPAFATVRYTLWDRVELGVRAEITGHTYAFRGASDDPLDHVRYTLGAVGLTAGLRLTSSVWLTAFAGASVYRRGEQLDRDDQQLPGTSHDLPQVSFVRTDLAWRLPGS
jgi:hypothetical protein